MQRIVSRNSKRNAEMKKTIADHLPMLQSDFLTKTLGVGKNNPLWQRSNLMISTMNAELFSTLENSWLKHEESKVGKMMKKFEKFQHEQQELQSTLNDRLKKEQDEFQTNVMNRDAPFWTQFNSSTRDVQTLWKNKENEERRFEKRLKTYQNAKFKKNWMKTYIPKENAHYSRSPSPEHYNPFTEIRHFGKFRNHSKDANLDITNVANLKEKVKNFRKNKNRIKKTDITLAGSSNNGSQREEPTAARSIAGQKEFKRKGLANDEIILRSSHENKYKKASPFYMSDN